MKLNTQTLEALKDASGAIYNGQMEIFHDIKALAVAFGEGSPTEAKLIEEGIKVETAFNDTVLTSFNALRSAISQSVENADEFQRFVNNMEPIGIAGVTGAGVVSNVTAPNFV
jgi:hypothetical protein